MTLFMMGKYNSLDKAISRVSEMINQGVDIIDVGAVSSNLALRSLKEKMN